MILDNNWILDTGTAISLAANAIGSSTNVANLQNARDLGVGDDKALKFMCMVTNSLLSTNSATIQVLIQGSTDNSHFTTMAESDQITMANATTGARLLDIDLPRPGPGQSLPQYIGCAYKATTGAITTGNITSAFVLDRQDYPVYPPGIVVAN